MHGRLPSSSASGSIVSTVNQIYRFQDILQDHKRTEADAFLSVQSCLCVDAGHKSQSSLIAEDSTAGKAARAVAYADGLQQDPSPTAIFEEMAEGENTDSIDGALATAQSPGSGEILHEGLLKERPKSRHREQSLAAAEEVTARPLLRKSESTESLKTRPARPAVQRNFPYTVAASVWGTLLLYHWSFQPPIQSAEPTLQAITCPCLPDLRANLVWTSALGLAQTPAKPAWADHGVT